MAMVTAMAIHMAIKSRFINNFSDLVKYLKKTLKYRCIFVVGMYSFKTAVMKRIYLLFLSIISFVPAALGQAPDGASDIFQTSGAGTLWNDPNSWIPLIGLDDPVFGFGDGIPDGDDVVIINHNITVAINSGFGELSFVNTTNAAINLTVNAGIQLLSNNLTYAGNVGISAESSSNTVSSIIVNGELLCDSVRIANLNSGIGILSIRNGGKVAVSGDVALDGTASFRAQLQAAIGTGNNIEVSGSISGLGRVNLGNNAAASTLLLNGSSAQNIPVLGNNYIYSNIIIDNSAGVTLGGVLTNTIFNGSLTINNSSSFSDGDFDIAIEANFENNGADFTQSIGRSITFLGTAAQTLQGTATNNWKTFNLNNSNGLTVNSGTQTITNVLNIDNGALNNAGGNVVLMSTVSGTAQMANIDAGSYTGNMEVRRLVSKTNQGYVTFASPVSGTTLNAWHDGGIANGQEFIFSGFTGADYPTFSFNNAYDYNEVISGTDRNAGFEAADDIFNPTGVDNLYKAHYVWADAVTYNLSVTGVPNTGPINIPLTMTSAGGVANDGWNLIGNPFPCTVDWEVVNNSLVGVEDFYSVYSYETGNFASYEGGIGGLNGGTQYIPSSQGFWVQAGVAVATLNIDESAKASSQNPNFIKSSVDVMRISISGAVNGYSDEAIVLTGAQYDNNMELGDRAKWYTYDTVNSPTVYTESYDAEKLSVNKFSNAGDLDVSLMAVSGTGATGTYTLEFNYPATFMANSCIMLEDLYTSTLTDLRQSNTYSFLTSDTTTSPRFIIHLGKNFTAEPVAASCVANTDGSIDITGDNISGSSFTLLDNANNILSSETASSTTVTFDNLAAGDYYLVSDYSGNCGAVDTIAILIEAENNVTAEFVASADTLLLDASGDITFTNNSNGVNFTWDFGDGNQSTDQNPNYTYVTAGTYQVTLTSVNAVGCTETSSQTIVVGYSADLSIDENEIEVSWFVDGENLIIKSIAFTNKAFFVQIYDATGKLVSKTSTGINGGQIMVSINDIAKGSYIVTMTDNVAVETSFKIVK